MTLEEAVEHVMAEAEHANRRERDHTRRRLEAEGLPSADVEAQVAAMHAIGDELLRQFRPTLIARLDAWARGEDVADDGDARRADPGGSLEGPEADFHGPLGQADS